MSRWLSRALESEPLGSRDGELDESGEQEGEQEEESDRGMVQAEELAFAMYKVIFKRMLVSGICEQGV